MMNSLFSETQRRFQPTKPLDLKGSYRFSRFACIHVIDGSFVIESPFSPLAIHLKSKEIFQILMVLAKGACLKELLEPLSDRERKVTIQILEKCHDCCLLSPLYGAGQAEEDQDDLQTWEFHDLYFHTRSRRGRHFNEFGGTYRFGDSLQPLPAFKTCQNLKTIPLYTPDMTRIETTDPSLATVMERRKSVRNYGADPLQLRQLGEFLYRTCRHVTVQDTGSGGEVCHRVVPSGGGMHPLSLYLIVHECQDLEQGAYHYNPLAHSLELIASWNEDMTQLTRDAMASSGIQRVPPVLICLSARFKRTAWKYSGIAYATILKDVGCLYQTFYLVATAMGLAPCGLGAGDSDTFARVIGSRYYDETTVGEFMLGPT